MNEKLGDNLGTTTILGDMAHLATPVIPTPLTVSSTNDRKTKSHVAARLVVVSLLKTNPTEKGIFRAVSTLKMSREEFGLFTSSVKRKLPCGV